nr:hypothetical protein HK105_001459 [Polyrhizophydium stewartii]
MFAGARASSPGSAAPPASDLAALLARFPPSPAHIPVSLADRAVVGGSRRSTVSAAAAATAAARRSHIRDAPDKAADKAAAAQAAAADKAAGSVRSYGAATAAAAAAAAGLSAAPSPSVPSPSAAGMSALAIALADPNDPLAHSALAAGPGVRLELPFASAFAYAFALNAGPGNLPHISTTTFRHRMFSLLRSESLEPPIATALASAGMRTGPALSPIPATPVSASPTSIASVAPRSKSTSLKRTDLDLATMDINMLPPLPNSAEVELTGPEMVTLFGYLLSLTPEALVQFQKETHGLSESGNKSSSRFTWYLPPVEERYDLTVETPPSGRLRRTPFTFKFTLTYRVFTVIRAVVMLQVKGGYRHFFVINTESRTDERLRAPRPESAWDPTSCVLDSAFVGTAISRKQSIPGPLPGQVPKGLAHLRMLLQSKQGLMSIGIFREKGTPWDVSTLHTKTHAGVPWDCSDVHAIATCIKLLLRETLANIVIVSSAASATGLSRRGAVIDAESLIAACTSEDGSWATFSGGFDTESDAWQVMLWALDLMAVVALHRPFNQMGIKSVATAFAPNLCTIDSTPQALKAAQHLVQFLSRVLERHMRELGMHVELARGESEADLVSRQSSLAALAAAKSPIQTTATTTAVAAHEKDAV